LNRASRTSNGKHRPTVSRFTGTDGDFCDGLGTEIACGVTFGEPIFMLLARPELAGHDFPVLYLIYCKNIFRGGFRQV